MPGYTGYAVRCGVGRSGLPAVGHDAPTYWLSQLDVPHSDEDGVIPLRRMASGGPSANAIETRDCQFSSPFYVLLLRYTARNFLLRKRRNADVGFTGAECETRA